MLIQTAPDSWASESIKRIRDKCREDALYLARNVLGRAYAQANEGVNLFETPTQYHLEANEILKRQDNAIILAPRGHLKTELITIAGTISFFLRNPNHRTLIVSETPKTAMKSLRAIKDTLQNNAWFRNLFPEYRIDSGDEEGTQNWFDVPCRRGPKKDFSVEVIGVGGATAGGHFDRIVTTDIVSNLTVPPMVQVETMEKTSAFVNALEPLLNKSNKRSHIIIEGTIWSYGDPYCMVLSNPGYAHYKRIVVSCWERDSEGREVVGEDGRRKPMWPELHTTDELERIRAKDEAQFSCYYENAPKPADQDRMFRPSWFRQYRWGERGARDGIQQTPSMSCPCCGGALRIAITSDLAISQARTSDLTVHAVTGVCPQGAFVILDMAEGRWTPYESVDRLYELDVIWKPLWIGIESVAWQKAMMYILHEEGKKVDRYPLVVREFKPDNSPNGKLRRIGMLAAYAQSHGLWVRPGDHDAFVDECLRMTRHGSLTGHDDRMDAAAYRTMDMVRAEGPVVEVKRKRRPTALTDGSVFLDEMERKGRLGLAGGGYFQ